MSRLQPAEAAFRTRARACGVVELDGVALAFRRSRHRPVPGRPNRTEHSTTVPFLATTSSTQSTVSGGAPLSAAIFCVSRSCSCCFAEHLPHRDLQAEPGRIDLVFTSAIRLRRGPVLGHLALGLRATLPSTPESHVTVGEALEIDETAFCS